MLKVGVLLLTVEFLSAAVRLDASHCMQRTFTCEQNSSKRKQKKKATMSKDAPKHHCKQSAQS